MPRRRSGLGPVLTVLRTTGRRRWGRFRWCQM